MCNFFFIFNEIMFFLMGLLIIFFLNDFNFSFVVNWFWYCIRLLVYSMIIFKILGLVEESVRKYYVGVWI